MKDDIIIKEPGYYEDSLGKIVRVIAKSKLVHNIIHHIEHEQCWIGDDVRGCPKIWIENGYWSGLFSHANQIMKYIGPFIDESNVEKRRKVRLDNDPSGWLVMPLDGSKNPLLSTYSRLNAVDWCKEKNYEIVD